MLLSNDQIKTIADNLKRAADMIRHYSRHPSSDPVEVHIRAVEQAAQFMLIDRPFPATINDQEFIRAVVRDGIDALMAHAALDGRVEEVSALLKAREVVSSAH